MHQKADFWANWQRAQQLGVPRRQPLGSTDELYSRLYHKLSLFTSWDPMAERNVYYGGIFNLEFTPDGSLLAATAENRSLLLFDPLNHFLVASVSKAHEDCVNYARFLDSRMLATCSDDTTVALWDVRFLKTKVRTLVGHSNWVKNIEFAREAGLLVTSGFDGSIFTWDINKYSEAEVPYKQVFHSKGLMRMRLSPDCSQMVVCTSHGYLMVIHNLDFEHLRSDLLGFKPHMYRQMQCAVVAWPETCRYNGLFSASRNRVELIADFPPNNEAEVISSLQVHPQGWCILSRNTSSDEHTEWTCIHDIQELPGHNVDDHYDLVEAKHPRENLLTTTTAFHLGPRREDGTDSAAAPSIHIRYSSGNQSNYLNTESIHLGNLEFHLSQELPQSQALRDPLPTFATMRQRHLALASFIQSTIAQARRQAPARPNYIVIAGGDSDSSSGDEEPPTSSPSNPFLLRTSPPAASPPGPQKVLRNIPRLLYYTEEPNVGRGYIKELCFSSDGRLVCSPYGLGVRLLAFNRHCNELNNAVPEKPTELYELARITSHENYVVSTKFSPTHCLLVSGCLNGKICFHQPVL